MIKFNNLSQETPFILFKDAYYKALDAGQNNIGAISISSFNKEKNEVDSRYVNLKFVDKDNFIFFSNYNSPKSIAFSSNNQIAGLFYWPSINIQIRMKAIIKKTSIDFNKDYFAKRSIEKNALAISSQQSQQTESYEDVIDRYKEIFKKNNLLECPEYWGGFSFKPYEIEFWEGSEFRLNKRNLYKFEHNSWDHIVLQP